MIMIRNLQYRTGSNLLVSYKENVYLNQTRNLLEVLERRPLTTSKFLKYIEEKRKITNFLVNIHIFCHFCLKEHVCLYLLSHLNHIQSNSSDRGGFGAFDGMVTGVLRQHAHKRKSTFAQMMGLS